MLNGEELNGSALKVYIVRFLFLSIIFCHSLITFAKKCPRIINNLNQHATTCKSCHKKEYYEWEKSRHSRAFVNEVFQKGFLQDRLPRCLNCHLPNKTFDPFLFKEDLSKITDSRKAEGVSCINCHYAKAENILLNQSAFCARCHQFTFKGHKEMAQSTFSEWGEYKKNGGEKSCQACHMKEGSHKFFGAHNSFKGNTSLKFKVSKKSKWQLHDSDITVNIPKGFPGKDATLVLS